MQECIQKIRQEVAWLRGIQNNGEFDPRRVAIAITELEKIVAWLYYVVSEAERERAMQESEKY